EMAGGKPHYGSGGRNLTHMGLLLGTGGPTGCKWPVVESILNTTTVSESWLAASSQAPAGSISNWRGVRPPVGARCANVRRPLAGSHAKTAMLSSPRLEA